MKKSISTILTAAIMLSITACTQSNVTTDSRTNDLNSMIVSEMDEYIISSRVTSANVVAANIRNLINNFLADADAYGYGMKAEKNIIDTLDIQINDGIWTVSAGNAECYNSNGNNKVIWGAEGKGSYGEDKNGVMSAEKILAIQLANALPDIKNGAAALSMVGGICCAVAFSDEKNTKLVAQTDYPAFSDGKFPDMFAWNGKNNGVTSAGTVVGTSPVVPLG